MTTPYKIIRGLLLAAFVASDVTPVGGSSKHIMYERKRTKAGEYLWLARPLTAWLSGSSTECVRTCVRLGGQCGAVEFDQLSGNCTVGGMVVKSSDGPAPPQHQPSAVFYSRHGMCDSEPGFSYVAHYDKHVCLHVSSASVKLRWHAAVNKCKSKGARLYVMKSREKFIMLRNYRKGRTDAIWIGLRDTVGDKTMLWVGDDEHFKKTNPLWSAFWQRGQPNYNKPGQECVLSLGSSSTFYDVGCNAWRQYACEINLP